MVVPNVITMKCQTANLVFATSVRERPTLDGSSFDLIGDFIFMHNRPKNPADLLADSAVDPQAMITYKSSI
uniref:Uncharacterized protein n=1 Tax=Trichuris muris TaxID=70415 RepID=A0A5S6R3K9_TRIMR